ncbi:DUF3786 domain-containing protein [Chloroflexota bacterium]
MKARSRTPEETYAPALDKAQRALVKISPGETAARAGVSFDAFGHQSGRFVVNFFGRCHHVAWPQGTVVRADDQKDVDIATRIILLHYLLTADGTRMADKWVAFRSLPGGLGYDGAFQRRSCLPLAARFGSDAEVFDVASRALGGESLTYGDASFLFRVLPRVWMAVVVYYADDEFPATANVLYDASASHYLPTEDLAVLGGLLASRLMNAIG